MNTKKAELAEKIAHVQAALDEGALASHDLIRSLDASDSKTASSWGPAMRR